MGNPITWQNVNSSDSRLAAQLLAGAQQGITGSFDKFGDIIAQREAVNQGAADRARGAAEQEFMNQLYGYKNPAELQAARESGALAQQLAGLDPRNQAAARTALDNRLGTLQGQITANDAFAVNQEKQPMVMANAAADVANANDLRAQTRMKIDRDNKVLPTQYATDVLAAANNNRAEVFKGTRAPGLEALTLQEDVLKGSQLAVDATTTAQQRQDQIIAAETAKAAQSYQDQQLAGRLKLAPFATKLGLPLDASGAPDWNNMTTGERLKLDDAAIRAGVTTSTSAPLFSGDTGVANKFLAGLRQTPGVTPEAISRNQSKITGAFNTVSAGAPVGNDALAIDRRLAQAEVMQKEKDVRNRFAPNSPDALNTYEQLANDLPTLVPDDAKEDIPALQEMLGRFATTGIKLKDGRYITPSIQDIKSAVRGYTPNWKGNWFNNTQAKDIEKKLAKDLEGSNVTQLLLDAEESRRANRARDVRNILNPVIPAQAPLNPLGLPAAEPKRR